MERVAYSPKEFAELFGKSQSWGYRQIYNGAVSAITEHGRILIPAGEVGKILKSAQIQKAEAKPATVPQSDQKQGLRSVLINGSKKRHGSGPPLRTSVPRNAPKM